MAQLDSACHACIVLHYSHRGTPTLVEPLSLFWGFSKCRSYSTELQPFIYKLSMKCDWGELTWAGYQVPIKLLQHCLSQLGMEGDKIKWKTTHRSR